MGNSKEIKYSFLLPKQKAGQWKCKKSPETEKATEAHLARIILRF